MNWISVDDKLPPDYQEVLFFAITNEGMSREIMVGHRVKESWFHCCMFYLSTECGEAIKVTHWMELPDYPGINNE